MKKALTIGAILLALGILIGLGGLCIMGFDFSKLLSTTYATYTYTPEGDFSNISVTGVTCDIRFAKSEDDTCTVICKVDDRYVPTVEVKDGKLSIHVDDNLKWWQRIGIYWGSNDVTVYLPENEYNKLEANTTTGDIVFDGGIPLSDVKLTATTGDIQVSSLSCDSFFVKVTTGNIILRNVITANMTLTATTGDIELDRCDGNRIELRSTTGDVKGSLCTGKQFTAKATTGDVRVPSDSGSGTCSITTTTGDIKITVE